MTCSSLGLIYNYVVEILVALSYQKDTSMIMHIEIFKSVANHVGWSTGKSLLFTKLGTYNLYSMYRK